MLLYREDLAWDYPGDKVQGGCLTLLLYIAFYNCDFTLFCYRLHTDTVL